MCTVLLPPGVNPIAVDKCIINYHCIFLSKSAVIIKPNISTWMSDANPSVSSQPIKEVQYQTIISVATKANKDNSLWLYSMHQTEWYFSHCSCCIRYTGCNRRNGPDFGRVFLMLNYNEKPQNTYIQSWMVSEIIASEVWTFVSCYTLSDYQIHIETGRNMWFL